MPVAILTDSTVSFPSPVFPGRELVHILAPQWQPPRAAEAERLKASHFPASLRANDPSPVPQLVAPRAADFEAVFRQLGPSHAGVLTLLHSNHFSAIEEEAQAAAGSVHGKVAVRVVDSLTTSLGLGLLVQAAAAASAAGMGLAELELYVRGLVPNVFGILCVPGLSYLERSGQVNHSQAVVGEYLDILQVFTLDNGQLVPTQKARNTRQLVDAMYEFLSEFTDLSHLALLQGAPAFEAETRALRERLAEEGYTTPISEQIINAPLASFIGPRSLGLFAIRS
ncbi:MAG: DegV family EDD domain-containing protein [Anaerolineales bacterium]|nr:DegV family EDD domain-containing protein [Anaerolineales bacterium]MCW5838271.1 DegV family EDD domain-containing protein [Anaerolineales bacterium]